MEPARVLVVANQTACGEELLAAIHARMSTGPCTFTLLVPATPPAEHATWTEGDAKAIARARMSVAVEHFVAEGAAVEGMIGDPNPVRAIDDALIDHPHDEIILSTLPPGISRWLNKDLPHRVEQRFGIPVTTVISARQPTA